MYGSVLITGAARRIGRHIAGNMAAKGWTVVVHYNRSADDARALVHEIGEAGGRAACVQADLSTTDAPKRLIVSAGDIFGPLTCLINNASCFEPDEAGNVTAASFAAHIDTNLRAPVLLSQAFADQLPQTKSGNIVNIIDQRVWKLTPRFFSYTVSKAALWTVTQTLAQAFAPRIRVNAIGPGPTLPNIRMDEKEFAKQSRLTLLQRGTSPQEIFQALQFILASPAMTGQMIVLDGGQHLVWQTADVMAVSE